MNQAVDASSLQYDPYTTCNSYDIGDKSFPGRGSEILDDGNCVVTVPEDPNVPPVAAVTTISVLDTSLLSKTAASPTEPVFTKVGTEVMSEKLPYSGTDQDEYVAKEQATGTPASTTTTTSAVNWSGLPKTTSPLLRNISARRWSSSSLPRRCTSRLRGPIYQDSINFKWDKHQPSPAEKYAKAFGLNVTAFMDGVSAQNGINSRSDLPQWTSDRECYNPKVDTVCTKRTGKQSGYCIPTWFGICHAWAPATILEKEPNCPVKFNGVTFQPMDIKALVTEVYDAANISTVFTGSRYNNYTDSIDDYGSHTDYSYRDLNPGFFLGLLNSTFIIDRDIGTEVWNQPVVGFKVYEQTAMTPQKAANTFFGVDSYDYWNENATSIVYVKSRHGGRRTRGVGSQQELDDAEKFIGGEWLYGSNNNHPDFLWFVAEKSGASTVTQPGLKYADVTMLLEKAVICAGTNSPSAPAASH